MTDKQPTPDPQDERAYSPTIRKSPPPGRVDDTVHPEAAESWRRLQADQPDTEADRTAPDPDAAAHPSPLGQFMEKQLGVIVRTRLASEEPTAGPHAGGHPRLGRYEVTGRLGAGGMGTVYMGADEDLGRQIAIKVLNDQRNPQSLMKFVAEAQITGQLEHPNIVAVHELGLGEEDRLYFTMKRVCGRTLEELLSGIEARETLERQQLALARTAPSPPLELPLADRSEAAELAPAAPTSLIELLQIFLKACDAVAFAHSKGVIHRDLKPANIMVGEFGEVQVMDWGLAKVIGQPESESEATGPSPPRDLAHDLFNTRDGDIVGTPSYMPPEQAAGKVDLLDQRSDIYSLGAILYEILTLRPPYTGNSLMEVLEDVETGRMQAPTEAAPQRAIPWELEQVVLKATARRRLDRYPTVEQLRADIVLFLEGKALSVARYTPWQLLSKWLRRHRAGVTLASALLVAGIALTAWGAARLEARREFRRHHQQAREAARRKGWLDAMVSCRRALDLQPDPGLTKLLEEATRQIAREEARKLRLLDEAGRFRRLQAQLLPLARDIEETRPLFYVARADIRRELDQVEQTVKKMARLAEDPQNRRFGELWLRLGMGWYFIGDMRQAEAALLQALKRDVPGGAANYYLGRVYLDRALAAQLTRVEGEGRPRSVAWATKAAHQLALSRDRMGGGRKIDQLLATAYLALASGEHGVAIELCKMGLARHARELDAAEFWLIRARVGLLIKDNKRALTACREVIAWKPHEPWAYVFRASVHTRLKKLELARRDYDAALEKNERLACAYVGRGVLKRLSGDITGAIEDYDRAIALQPDYVAAYYNRGNARRALGSIPGAIEDYDRVIALHPSSWRALLNRGACRHSKKDLDGALRDFEQATRVNPGAWEAWFNLGQTQMRRGRRAKAIRALERALMTAPTPNEKARIERLLRRWK